MARKPAKKGIDQILSAIGAERAARIRAKFRGVHLAYADREEAIAMTASLMDTDAEEVAAALQVLDTPRDTHADQTDGKDCRTSADRA